jgi:hypothetical protein
MVDSYVPLLLVSVKVLIKVPPLGQVLSPEEIVDVIVTLLDPLQIYLTL